MKLIENIKKFGIPVVVAINAFPTDTAEELDELLKICAEHGVGVALSEVWAQGGKGGIHLAQMVAAAIEKPALFKLLYDIKLPIKEKIATIAREIYRADNVVFTTQAEKSISELSELGFSELPICIAKTQYSFSDDEKKIGSPRGFAITVREIRLSAGAGFIVAICGNIMTMPGLPKRPAAEKMDIDANGLITGLF